MSAAETHSFQAEVNQVLHLVIHSLYSHREVFLRELISNASDALDKLRFRAITEPDLLKDDPKLAIRISLDSAAGTIVIDDNGVGMSKEELAEHLGTVARSGSRNLIEQLKAQNDRKTSDVPQLPNLIGQFGVGFYSAFLVADRVEVVSRAADGVHAHKWTSEGKDTFTLEPAERGPRGTAVTLHLKADQKDLLEPYRVRELVRRYSDYVEHPIELRKPAKDGATTDIVAEWETLNRATALWQRPKAEITDAEHEEFYKHLSHDFEAPLARTHFRVEGAQEFVALLYLPRRAPFDMDFSHRGVRLFIKRVFVMDDCTELVPEWLRFLRGVVDSNDLPLNVSREVLQDAAIVRGIKKQLTKKTLDLLDELAKDRPADYLTFWRAFGPVLKAGVHMEPEHKARVAALLRYESTLESEGLTSLGAYVSRMKEGQPAIYYAFGDRKETLADSPYLEALRKRGYEVLFMTDPGDEWVADGLSEFEGKKLISVMRADLKLEGEDDKKKDEETAAEWKPLFERVRSILQERVTEVRVSHRLIDSPVCLVLPEGSHHAYVERVLRSYGRGVPKQKRILELNPEHALVKKLRAKLESEPTSPDLTDAIELLHDQALLQEGSPVAEPQRFARRLTALLEKGLA
jgi:molecular chaperone HtpG